MRFSHFEYYSPQCPLCIQQQMGFHPLDLQVFKGSQKDGWIEEGNFLCNHCGAIYPVIRGIPILVPQVGSYLQQYYMHTIIELFKQNHNLATLLSPLTCCFGSALRSGDVRLSGLRYLSLSKRHRLSYAVFARACHGISSSGAAAFRG